jgi:hypothetical protein
LKHSLGTRRPEIVWQLRQTDSVYHMLATNAIAARRASSCVFEPPFSSRLRRARFGELRAQLPLSAFPKMRHHRDNRGRRLRDRIAE